MNYTIPTLEERGEEAGFVFDVDSLYAHMSHLDDLRDPRGTRYALPVVLVLVVLAKLAGEDEPRGIAEWVKLRAEKLIKALGLSRSEMPHQTTYSRVLGKAVDIEQLESVVGHFFSQRIDRNIAIAIDGKTLRGTIEPGKTQGLHLLAAYVPDEGVVLMQVAVETHENEIVAAPELLECLDLRGRVVTGDAMFTQTDLSVQIVQAGGHYLWKVKDNQPTLRQDIELLFEPERPPLPGHSAMPHDFATCSDENCGHGRFERRTITVSSRLKGYSDWPYLEQVFKIERHVSYLKSGQRMVQVLYGVTSLPADQASPQRLLTLTRAHWYIENRLHYPRDVSLKEDRCRLGTGHAAHAMAIINNLVLGLIRRQDFDYIPQARRFYNAHLDDAVQLLLGT